MNSYYKILILLCALIIPQSCLNSVHKLHEEFEKYPCIDTLQNHQIRSLEGQEVALEEAIEAVKALQTQIRDARREVGTQADKIEAEKKKLENQIKDILSRIGRDTTALVNELATAKKEAQDKLDACYEAIAKLEEADEKFEKTIVEYNEALEQLRKDYDAQNEALKAWMEGTFVTLEAQKELQEAIELAYTALIDVQKRVEEMKDRLDTKLLEDLNSLEERVKQFVTTALTDYYKKAEIDAQIASLQAQITTQGKQIDSLQKARVELAAELAASMADMQKRVDDLCAEASNLEKELTEGYQNAIRKAIEKERGKIAAEVLRQLEAINIIVNGKLSAVSANVTALERKMTNLEREIAQKTAQLDGAITLIDSRVTDLMNMVQSISCVRQTEDGTVPVDINRGHSMASATIDFVVSPAAAVERLEGVWKSALSVKAVRTTTKAAPEILTLPVVGYKGNPETGRISLTVNALALGESFFTGATDALAALSISNGVEQITSNFGVQLTPNENIPVGIELVYYTSRNNTAVTLSHSDYFCGESVAILDIDYGDGTTGDELSHIYRYSGEHTVFITLSARPKEIVDNAFLSCSALRSIAIPSTVQRIGVSAFMQCTGLTGIAIPSGCVTVGDMAFWGCSGARGGVTIPAKTEQIGVMAFYGCTGLTGNLVIENGEHVFSPHAFTSNASTTSTQIPFSRVYSYCPVPPTCEETTFGSTTVSSGHPLYVPSGCKSAYQQALGWSKFTTINATL